MSGENGFCPHKDPEYDGPSRFWCDDCAEIKDRIRDRDQRRYEIARDVMVAKHGAYWGVSNPEGAARDAVYAADALLAALETER